MNVQIEKINYSISFRGNEKIPMLFLHGFTDKKEYWNTIITNFNSTICIDLLGHGWSDISKNILMYGCEKMTLHLKEILDVLNIKKVVLIGYSMGGRLALQFAYHYPEYVKALVLESSTAGIEDKDERMARIQADEKLIKHIQTKGVQSFVNYWLELPLFEGIKSSLSPSDYKAYRNQKMRQHPTALTNMLRGFGTGAMPSLWNKLPTFTIPTLLITGELDKKFTELNKRMASLLPNATHRIVEDCGHSIHLENPIKFICLLKEFLLNQE